MLRALELPLTIVKEYSLRLVVDKETVELGSSCMAPGGSGPPCQLLFPVGEGSSANGVMVDLPRALLERIAGAQAVAGTALGFPIVFSSNDRAAVARFAQEIHVTATSAPPRAGSSPAGSRAPSGSR